MHQIEAVPLESSSLDCAGWSLGRLYIRFKTGTTYSYDNVPKNYLDTLKSVESAGRFFSRFIRGHYHYTKMDKDPFTG